MIVASFLSGCSELWTAEICFTTNTWKQQNFPYVQISVADFSFGGVFTADQEADSPY